MRGASFSHRWRFFSIAGFLLRPAEVGIRARRDSPEMNISAATSSSVFHSPCGSMRTLKLSPPSSTFARADDEMRVARTKVSRSYRSTSSPALTDLTYVPFFSSASLTSNKSAKSDAASRRTVSRTGFASWFRIVSSSWKPLPTARRRITDSFEST
jgi:hypothetical protein